MGMTITEKIISRASRKERVKPNEIVTVEIDLCMSNDATTHINIDIMSSLRKQTIFDPDKVIFVIDHNFPAESVETAEVHKKMSDFALKNKIRLYEGKGVCHQLMMENHVLPGMLVLAADSHTCTYGALSALGIGVGSTDIVAAMSAGSTWLMVPQTIRFELNGRFLKGVYARDLILKIIGDIGADGANYKIMEFGGSAVKRLSIAERAVLCNMAVEAGAKSGIFEADDTTVEYFLSRNQESGCLLRSDADAEYEKVFTYNLDELEPMVAKPHSVDKTATVSEVSTIPVTQAFIGSCNSGRIEDLRVAAEILSNKYVAESVCLMISPASNDIYLKAIEEGLIETFSSCGAMILNPNCSVCWGGCQGVIGKDDTLISTGTRNFKGRAGHPDSSIFLASVATVAASALTGYITESKSV